MNGELYYVVLRGLQHSVHPDFEEAQLAAKLYLRKHPEDAPRISVMRKSRYIELRAQRAERVAAAPVVATPTLVIVAR